MTSILYSKLGRFAAVLFAGMVSVTAACDRTEEGIPNEGPTCAERCAPFAACTELTTEQCAATCLGSAVGSKALECLDSSVECSELTACLGLTQPFSAGPYGWDVFDVAAPFTVPTLDGDWSFEESWTGSESHIFVLFSGGYTYAEALWSSDVDLLLQRTPRNVHYFFLSYVDMDGVDRVAENIDAIHDAVEAAISRLPDAEDQSHWRARMHFVTTEARALGNWIGDLANARGVFAFAVDRLQRVREVGLLFSPGNPAGSAAAELRYLTHEARYYDFEWQREKALSRYPATAIPVLVATDVGGPFDNPANVDVPLPDLESLRSFDTMELELTLACPDGLDMSCGEWDYIVDLYLCDVADPDQCDVEIGRWITTYGRWGRWVTDVSPALALLGDGGTRRMRFTSSQHYVVDLSLRFSTRHKGAGSPSAATFLFSGGAFDETYNDGREPFVFQVPDGVTRVQLYAFITGHGWGVEVENCAEFCNHTHHFFVNGVEYVKDHPEAGTPEGCIDQIESGTVPNQYGTWPFGRGGWCPGLDVKPWVVDITDVLVSGDNNVTYGALFDGASYTPVPVPNPPGGFPADIRMSSHLIFWR